MINACFMAVNLRVIGAMVVLLIIGIVYKSTTVIIAGAVLCPIVFAYIVFAAKLLKVLEEEKK